MAAETIVFRRFLSLPENMRRDVAAFAISCAKRVNRETKQDLCPILLACGLINLVQLGFAQISIEDGSVYFRKIDGIEVHGLH